MVQSVKAKSLIDASVEDSVFVLDLGEDFQYLEVELPRYSTWLQSSKRGVAPELLALNCAFRASSNRLTEAISKSDRSQIEKMIKKELEKFEKKDKKDDVVLIKNVLISFVKALYTKRSAWTNDLSADRSS